MKLPWPLRCRTDRLVTRLTTSCHPCAKSTICWRSAEAVCVDSSLRHQLPQRRYQKHCAGNRAPLQHSTTLSSRQWQAAWTWQPKMRLHAQSDQQQDQQRLLRTSSQYLDQASQTAASWRSQALGTLRESVLLTYTTLVESVLVTLADVSRLSTFLNWLTPRLESGIGRLNGTRHRLLNGELQPLSLVNNTAPDFSIPAAYRACDFPFTADADSEGYHPAAGHFMSLCMKLVYERPAVIQDLAENHWGVAWRHYLSTGVRGSDRLYLDPKDKAKFQPHTRTMVLETERAVVVAFRGSEPTNLINFRSSGRIALLPQPGMGRVHAGFWTCLFWGDAEGGTLYSRLVEALTALPDADKPIYLTGHSLGAALALLFAQAANVQHPQLAKRIAAVYGFAAPRVGDAAFAAACEAAYPRRIYHFVHASDIVPRVPPQFLEYRHTGRERFITSFGRVLSDDAQIKRWHRIEGFGFLPLYLYKLCAGVAVRGEVLRTLYRIVLLVVLPGLADHWPSDYEVAMRRQVEQHEPDAG